MHLIDNIIILIYLMAIICVGIILRKRAAAGIEAYFLGGRSIPWWVLGASGMASNLDMTGTMVITSFFYIIGVKGFLVEIRGGVVLIMAMLMVFIGKWYSRSGVMTQAEWMQFRFGRGTQGDAARILSAIANVISAIGGVAFFFIGTGKLLSIFLPFDAKTCSLIMILIAVFYTTLSGLYGVAYTDLIQAFLIGFATIFVSVKAFISFDFAAITSLAPEGWTNIIPTWRMEMPSGYEIYNLFSLSIMFFFIKTMFDGFGGPGGYMAQRYFAAKTDRDSGFLSAQWIVLLAFRWPFIMAVAVLVLSLSTKISDPEMVLPVVLMNMIPMGIKGIVIAALLAAAMSTFDSTVNGAAAYIVKDIYHRYLNPKATSKNLVNISYISSIGIVIVGIILGWFTPSINAIWGWLMTGLGAGMILPLVLRWFWWRFNGYGFAVGTGAGMIGAIVFKLAFPYWPEWLSFLSVGSISLIAMITCTLLTTPTDEKVLIKFYRITRPFGAWKRIAAQLTSQAVTGIKKENRRDLIAILFAVPWQLSMFLTLVHLIIHKWEAFFVLLSIFLVSSIGLYHFWYKPLNVIREKHPG